MDELRAVRELQMGSEDALGWLIDRYTPYVHTVVSHIIGAYMSTADIEEVDADVFVSLWNHASEVKASSVKGWLGCVARNAAKNKLRELGRELPLEEDIILVTDVTPDSEVERRERERAVQRAVLGMEWPGREIFLRHYYYCQTVADIAEEMDMNPSTVKSQLSRGREKLRSVLAREFSDKGGTLNGMENL